MRPGVANRLPLYPAAVRHLQGAPWQKWNCPHGKSLGWVMIYSPLCWLFCGLTWKLGFCGKDPHWSCSLLHPSPHPGTPLPPCPELALHRRPGHSPLAVMMLPPGGGGWHWAVAGRNGFLPVLGVYHGTLMMPEPVVCSYCQCWGAQDRGLNKLFL